MKAAVITSWNKNMQLGKPTMSFCDAFFWRDYGVWCSLVLVFFLKKMFSCKKMTLWCFMFCLYIYIYFVFWQRKVQMIVQKCTVFAYGWFAAFAHTNHPKTPAVFMWAGFRTIRIQLKYTTISSPSLSSSKLAEPFGWLVCKCEIWGLLTKELITLGVFFSRDFPV